MSADREVLKKTVSLTTCYNVYEYLPGCTGSLLNQTIGLENQKMGIDMKGYAGNIYYDVCEAEQKGTELSDTKQETEIENSSALHVMIAADRNYFYPALVLLVSLLHNHRNHTVTVYFLHSGLYEQDQELLQELSGRWENKIIKCIEITEDCQQGLKGFGRFSVAAFYRILGMDMIPDDVERILYLDVDMVVNKDLSKLFSMDMDAPLAACYDINNELQGNIDYHKSVLGISVEQPYFNSGMLVLDMEYIREHHVKEKLLNDITEHFEIYSLIDQDALNCYYAGKTQYLPWQDYNCPCVPFLSGVNDKDFSKENLLTYQELSNMGNEENNGYDVTNQIIQRASVIHFCTSQKPWRDRSFYQKENMKAAQKIYNRYEKMLCRILPEAGLLL